MKRKNNIWILPLAVFGILFITVLSCEKDTTEPSLTLNADAGSDVIVGVGEDVELDGSNSSATEGSFDYNWSFLSKPDNSDAQLQNTNSESPLFTPDVEGDYIVELSISSGDQEDTDDVKVTATESDSPKEVSTDVGDNTTWTDRVSDPEIPDYIV
ncbi:MAG: hypothetical protein R6U04_06110, partial [Bacteroidales bacterium]